MQKIAYLLGAGFSHAITPNNKAPLTEELGRQLKGIFPQGIEDRYGFSPENIELFLTKVDLHLLENNDSTLENYRIELTNKILDIFDTQKLSSVNKPGDKIEISDIANRITDILFKRGDTILTTNYDCYLENILLRKCKWTPNKGWGDIFMSAYDDIYGESGIRILKLHGSINFILVAPLDKDGFNKKKLMLEHIIDDKCFPGCNMENGWEGTVREYIILPSYLKQFEYKEIFNLWKDAAFRIQKIDKLIVIGASLREADYPLRFLISLIGKNAKIMIIDPKATEIKSKMVNHIPVNPKNIEAIEQGIEYITQDFTNKIYTES